ncbi:MAG: ABC transporter substrate-binding protein [bacterium]|nr:ABC transporter substrate-binding protein [bacterium]
MKKILFIAIAVSLLLAFNSGCKKSNEYSIAWSHYTGWEPWDYADSSGILKKWAHKYKIKIKLVRVNNYVESINLYTAKKFQGCTMTNMDVLTIPATGGIDSTALIIGDFSNGNDGIVTKGEKTIKELKGKKINLVQFSVSHYLLSRALAMNEMKEKGLTLFNTGDEDIANLFLTEDKAIVVTWNPMLMQVRDQEGANLIFDSSQIPGEIIDMMVVHSDAPDALKKALVGAWYETMAVLSDSKKSVKAIEHMAKESGAKNTAEFNAQLKTTAMFYTAKEAADFAKDEKLKETMEYVRTFLFDNELFGKNAGSKDSVGISFPDGSVMGDKKNIRLRFDAEYMQMAADKKL